MLSVFENKPVFEKIKLLLALSTRNLWRQKRRNSVLLIAIIVAVSGVIVLNSLIRGMQTQMVEQAVSGLSAHINIQSAKFRDDPWVGHGFIEDSSKLDDLFLKQRTLRGWTTRIRTPVVVMSERETRGAFLVGIDPERESISFINDLHIEGLTLTRTLDNSVIIGRALFDQLRTKLGHRIVVTLQNAQGISQDIGFRISGVYDADTDGIEKQYIFTGKRALQQLLNTTLISEIAIRFQSEKDAQQAQNFIVAAFPDLDVATWQQLNPLSAFMFEIVDVVIFIWLCIVLLTLVFGLLNSLLTAVLERKREIGIVRAVGLRSSMVLAQIMLESVLLMVLGIVIGLLFAFLFLFWIHEGIDLSMFAAGVELMNLSPKIVPALQLRDVVLVVGTSLLLAVFASLLPAYRSARINPIEAIRS